MNNFTESWDDSLYPFAYLITIRTYGTWFHGDRRLSIDTHHGNNKYGRRRVDTSKNLEKAMKYNAKQSPFVLDKDQRITVDLSIRETCEIREFRLTALNVRTNHLHAVVSADEKPEKIIRTFKSHATRKLRDLLLISQNQRVWSRGGSRRYLWRRRYVRQAIDYVLFGQGPLDFE